MDEIKDWKDKLCNKFIKITNIKTGEVVDIFIVKDLYWKVYCCRFVVYSIVFNQEFCYEDFFYSELSRLSNEGFSKTKYGVLEII